MNFAPSVSTLASLCSRVSRTSSSIGAGAARTPATLLAAIAMPIPVEQTSIPRSASPAATFSPLLRVIRIVAGLARIGAEIHHFVASSASFPAVSP